MVSLDQKNLKYTLQIKILDFLSGIVLVRSSKTNYRKIWLSISLITTLHDHIVALKLIKIGSTLRTITDTCLRTINKKLCLKKIEQKTRDNLLIKSLAKLKKYF